MKVSQGLTAIVAAGALTLTSTAAAGASVPSVAEQAAEDLVVVDTLGSEATSEINEDLEASGQEPLSDDAYAVGINNSGDVVAIEDDGTEVTLESASAIDEEVQAAEDLAATAEAETDEASTESGVSTQDKGDS